MSKLTELLESHQIQLALATGISIIALAYFSKRVLSGPIPYLYQAVPAFIAVVAEGVIAEYKNSRFATTWYWVVTILLSTVLVIALHIL
jgi:hypothetical protein